MAELFNVLAGKSKDTFAIGSVEFYAAPLTIAEWAEFANLSDAGVIDFLAAKLQGRIKEPTTHTPDTITAEWVRRNVPQIMMETLQYVLLHGKMPEAQGKPDSR